MAATITIKKGTVQVKCPRTDLVEVVETSDGISFNLKGNLQLYYTDQFMQNPTKLMIKQASDNFPDKNLIFNLDNYRQPAIVDAT